MASVTPPRGERDERGVVYVEFLIAFFPLFVLFLGTCQLALITSAKLVVQHSASVSVRSAIVVLEESPDLYDGAPRGSLSEGQGNTRAVLGRLFGVVGVTAAPAGRLAGGEGGASVVQLGARMVSIRSAAYTPLLALAPDERAVFEPARGNLERSVRASLGLEGPAVDYTRAASAVTLHVAGTDAPPEPIPPKALLTTRVTYLFNCSVPLARVLMCDSLGKLLVREEPSILGGLFGADRTELGKRLRRSEAPGALEKHVPSASRFIALSGEASLPNQGAEYYREGE